MKSRRQPAGGRKSRSAPRTGDRTPGPAIDVKYDCRHFRGHVPCVPNKLRGRICGDCDEYEKISSRILLVKLGAIGDVIRTTPLAAALRRRHPGCRITWLTQSPEVVPPELAEEIRRPDAAGLFTVLGGTYDLAVNLDKDPEACLLLAGVRARRKFGFTWKSGHIAPATPAARRKLLTGLFDSLSRENTMSYLEEIFEICGMTFAGEEYAIRRDPAAEARWRARVEAEAGPGTVVGLNTGCGRRWTTRLWPPERWVELIGRLQAAGYSPLLLGGPDEDERNREYAKATGAWYPGHMPLGEFIALCAAAGAAVTQVSMMMHIAIAQRTPLVLLNNIFNAREFELYGRGVIVEPSSGCDCYYGETCARTRHCMLDIPAGAVFDGITRLVPPRR